MRKQKIILYIFLILSFSILLGIISYIGFSSWPGRVKPTTTPTIQTSPILKPTESDNILIVLFSLDGLGGEYINATDSPFLYSQLTDNTYTLNAQTNLNAETVPTHVSMITGLTQEHHGIYFNFVTSLTPTLDKETLFDYATDASYDYYSLVTKEKLLFLMAGKEGNNIQYVNKRSGEVVSVLDAMVNPSTDNTFVFVHIIDMDQTGHADGWGSTEYKAALKTLDANLQAMIIDFNAEFEGYRRYFIITADHSGDGKYNGSNCPKCLQIPLIVISGNSNKKYYLTKPGNQYRVYDTACVVLDMMKYTPERQLDCGI